MQFEEMVPIVIIPGVISEVRELKAAKSGATWAYAIKLTCAGISLELTTRDKKVADTLGSGQVVKMLCSLELFNGEVKINILRPLEDNVFVAIRGAIFPAKKAA